jgi:hypothetical protein
VTGLGRNFVFALAGLARVRMFSWSLLELAMWASRG